MALRYEIVVVARPGARGRPGGRTRRRPGPARARPPGPRAGPRRAARGADRAGRRGRHAAHRAGSATTSASAPWRRWTRARPPATLAPRPSHGGLASGRYDAIVCGGSFGGLAAVKPIGGWADHRPAGDSVSGDSALAVRRPALSCLTFLDCGHLEQGVHQVDPPAHQAVQPAAALLPLRHLRLPALLHRSLRADGRRVLRAGIRSARDGVVETTEGRFEAPIVVRPPGGAPRRARGGRTRPRAAQELRVEARQPFIGSDLHFYVGPSNGSRRLSIFPAEGTCGRPGVIGDSNLSEDLVEFLARHRIGEPGQTHGGFFDLAHDRPDPGRHVRGGRCGRQAPAGLSAGVAAPGLRAARGAAGRAGAAAGDAATRPCRTTGYVRSCANGYLAVLNGGRPCSSLCSPPASACSRDRWPRLAVPRLRGATISASPTWTCSTPGTARRARCRRCGSRRRGAEPGQRALFGVSQAG